MSDKPTKAQVIAEPASLLMDAWIITAFDFPTAGFIFGKPIVITSYGATDNFHPSKDIAAAWEVMEKMNALGFYVTIFNGVLGMWACVISKDPKPVVGKHKPVLDDTVPLAICRAALLAVIDD